MIPRNMEKEWVENRLIVQLQEMGYEHLIGSQIDGERESTSEVVLKGRFVSQLRKLNPWLDENNVTKVLRKVTHVEGTSLMESNQAFHEIVVNMASIQQDLGTGKKNQTVRFIDFDEPANNEFLVVEQLSITQAKGTIRPDLLIYVNGIPFVVIECKSPKLAADAQIPEAVNQLLRYQKDCEKLFHYNAFMIATSNDRAKAGTIGARARHYGEWKDPYPLTVPGIGDTPSPQDILVAGMLAKENLLDLIQNFIVYEPVEGKMIKKLARYQQFRAVNKTIHRVLHGKTNHDRGGVVWHTQGSGKSLTMVYLAIKLRRMTNLENPTIVVVTDRQDLDEQITKTFRRCQFPNPQQAASVKELRTLLAQGQGTTIMTLVQKFQTSGEEEQFPEITKASNIFVMVDESHRTQYSGLALNMRTAMPNACFLGFTGTPIDKNDKSTTRTFGSYIDKYTIEQAVVDGATVPIFYESRMVDLHVKGDSLDELFNAYFREYEEEDRDRIKKKYATEEAINSVRQRIQRVVLDIAQHFETHIKPNGFKAQIVTVTREAAVLYKELLDELTDYKSAVIISGGHNDKDHLKKYHMTKEQEKEMIARFKKPMEEDNLSFLIVCDKLLTGFDAPIEQVMYLDKPLKEHNLLQAIARTNRTYDKKTYGLIVDYYGVSRFLEEALGVFNESDIQGALESVDSEIPRLQSRHRTAMHFFDYIRHENVEACMQVLEPEDVRHAFDAAFKKFSESMDMIMPHPKANAYYGDLKFLGQIRQLAKNRYREERLDISDCGEKVRRLIEEHLLVSGINVIFEPIDILSNQFEKRLEEAKTPEAKAAEMEHALRHEIRVKLNENPVFYESLRERLETLLKRRKERQMDIEELFAQLSEMIQEARHLAQKSQEQGLDVKQYPFYQLLEKELPPFEDVEDIRTLTQLLTDTIEREAVVEWLSKDEVQRIMRSAIKKQLRVSQCPKTQVEMLAQQILDLAKIHYRR